MNNATFFGNSCALVKAWNKYLTLKGYSLNSLNLVETPSGYTITETESLADFATRKADIALRYDIGQIVMNPDTNRFGKVTGYKSYDRGPCYTSVFDNITVKCAGGEYPWTVPEDKPGKYDPEIPEGLLELAKAQLVANCPLKEPPCRQR